MEENEYSIHNDEELKEREEELKTQRKILKLCNEKRFDDTLDIEEQETWDDDYKFHAAIIHGMRKAIRIYKEAKK